MGITPMGRRLVATILTLLFRCSALYAFWFRIRKPESDTSLLRPRGGGELTKPAQDGMPVGGE